MKDLFQDLSEALTPVNFNTYRRDLSVPLETINRALEICDSIEASIQSLRELDILNLSEEEIFNE